MALVDEAGVRIFAKALELERSDQNAALCTVINVSGSTPRKVGAKMIVIDDGSDAGDICGSVGGGAIEHHIRQLAISSIRNHCARTVETSLKNQLAMCCGGSMTVFIEPIKQQKKFICFGAGHIAQALCPLMASLDFLVFVADERSDLLQHSAFDCASSRFDDLSIFSLRDMPFGKNTFVVVATHDHQLDQQVIEGVARMDFQYAALVGSKRKALMTKKRLMAKGFSLEQMERIVCPAGVDIAAVTPREIALSIAAQMVQIKNDQAQHMRNDSGGRVQQSHGF